MGLINVEIKARSGDHSKLREILRQHKARFVGIDLQTDTYFNVTNGRLKLRQGNIENNLIAYIRDDLTGPKPSEFKLVKVEDADGLLAALTSSCGILMIVRKTREIYFVDNVKIHLDQVPELGTFVEIEASNKDADKTLEELNAQCNYFIEQFGIQQSDLIAESYSDMLKGEDERPM